MKLDKAGMKNIIAERTVQTATSKIIPPAVDKVYNLGGEKHIFSKEKEYIGKYTLMDSNRRMITVQSKDGQKR